MLKQGLTLFTLASNNPQETVKGITYILPEKGMLFRTNMQLALWILFMYSTRGYDRCRYNSELYTLKGTHTFRKTEACKYLDAVFRV